MSSAAFNWQSTHSSPICASVHIGHGARHRTATSGSCILGALYSWPHPRDAPAPDSCSLLQVRKCLGQQIKPASPPDMQPTTVESKVRATARLLCENDPYLPHRSHLLWCTHLLGARRMCPRHAVALESALLPDVWACCDAHHRAVRGWNASPPSRNPRSSTLLPTLPARALATVNRRAEHCEQSVRGSS